MAELRVSINEQTYTLSCGDDEVAHVTALADYLDDHVQKLAHAHGRVAESRLLILAALNICDELFTARAAGADAAAEPLDVITKRAEQIAARLTDDPPRP